MIRIQFSSDEIKELVYQRYYHPRVQRKIEALWLKSHEGESVKGSLTH